MRFSISVICCLTFHPVLSFIDFRQRSKLKRRKSRSILTLLSFRIFVFPLLTLFFLNLFMPLAINLHFTGIFSKFNYYLTALLRLIQGLCAVSLLFSSRRERKREGWACLGLCLSFFSRYFGQLVSSEWTRTNGCIHLFGFDLRSMLINSLFFFFSQVFMPVPSLDSFSAEFWPNISVIILSIMSQVNLRRRECSDMICFVGPSLVWFRFSQRWSPRLFVVHAGWLSCVDWQRCSWNVV